MLVSAALLSNFAFIRFSSNGATNSTSSISSTMRSASFGERVITFPDNRNLPPRRFISPALMVIIFSPIPSITSITSCCEPFPMATITMTEAIPIKIPNEASKVRVLCERSAVTAIENEEKIFMIFFRNEWILRDSSKPLYVQDEFQKSIRLKYRIQTKVQKVPR